MPPRPIGDICPTCVGLISDGSDCCWNCNANSSALDGVTQRVTPISLYEKPSRLRDWLTFYKSSEDSLSNALAVAAIAQIFDRFLQYNEDWLRGLGVDYATVVPSTLRPPPHPLSVLLSASDNVNLLFRSPLRRTNEPLDHTHPNRDAFSVFGSVSGDRVLLLDDVYTSGARSQSAAYSLRAAGARVVALTVLGRRYNPAYNDRSAEILKLQKTRPFSWAEADRRT